MTTQALAPAPDPPRCPPWCAGPDEGCDGGQHRGRVEIVPLTPYEGAPEVRVQVARLGGVGGLSLIVEVYEDPTGDPDHIMVLRPRTARALTAALARQLARAGVRGKP